MKTILILLATLLTTSIISQTKTFKLSDTSFVVGQEYITRQIHFDLGKATLKQENNLILDTIVSFMTSNQNVKLEIEVHSDSRTNPNSSSNPTESRAKSISQYLINHNISSDRFVAKGYGASKLIVKNEQINKAKTNEEKEALHALNRRVVLKIIALSQK